VLVLVLVRAGPPAVLAVHDPGLVRVQLKADPDIRSCGAARTLRAWYSLTQ
jgi:hypothetical protein